MMLTVTYLISRTFYREQIISVCCYLAAILSGAVWLIMVTPNSP